MVLSAKKALQVLQLWNECGYLDSTSRWCLQSRYLLIVSLNEKSWHQTLASVSVSLSTQVKERISNKSNGLSIELHF